MRIVAGLFVGHRAVDLVVEHLVQEFGVPREQVQIHAADPSGEEARSTQDGDQDAALPGLGLPEEAVRSYEAGMRHGGILVAAMVEAGQVGHALDTYREYGAAHVEAFDRGMSGPAPDAEEAVRTRAYLLWEQAGRPEGRALEFWERARGAGAE